MRIATNSSKIDITKENKTASLAKIFSSFLNEGDIVVSEGLKKVRPQGKIKPINK